MRKFVWLTVIIIIGSFVGCNGDRILSNYLFEQYCNEEGSTGQFIYEQVGLGEEYFIPMPDKPEEKWKVNQRYVIGENSLIDKIKLEQHFIIGKYKESELLSQIGPIVSRKTSVIRKRDNKLLGKSVSLVNRLGWLNLLSILGQSSREYCPKGYDRDKGLSEDEQLHATLIKNIFYRK